MIDFLQTTNSWRNQGTFGTRFRHGPAHQGHGDGEIGGRSSRYDGRHQDGRSARSAAREKEATGARQDRSEAEPPRVLRRGDLAVDSGGGAGSASYEQEGS